MSLTARIGISALVLSLLLPGGRALAENDGKADLDRATKAKLTARTLTDLDTVIRLLEKALEAGLDAGNTLFAEEVLASTRIQRGLSVTQTIMGTMPPDPSWPQFRRFALGDLEKGVEFDSDQPRALLAIAQLNLLPGGDAKRAAEALEQVIELSSDEPAIKAQALLLRAGISEDAKQKLKDLDEAIEANPTDVTVLRARSQVLQGQGKIKEALADLAAALEVEPDHVPTLLARVVLLIDLGRQDEAMPLLDRAVRLAPQSAVPLLHRAQVRGMKGDFKTALEDLEKAYTIDPGHVGVLLMRASVYQQLDEPEKALADVDRALELRPGLTPAIRFRVSLLAGSGDFGEAITQLEELKETSPDDVNVALQLALFYNAEKRPRKSVEVYTQIIEEHPDNGLALEGRGDALLSIGKHGRAIADYEKALKLLPDDPSLFNNLSWVLSTSPIDNLRDGARSVELATKACELTDYKFPHILSTLAAAYAETGDFDTAIKWSKKAVELGGDETEQLAKELESYREKKPWRERQVIPEGGEPEEGEKPKAPEEEKPKPPEKKKPKKPGKKKPKPVEVD